MFKKNSGKIIPHQIFINDDDNYIDKEDVFNNNNNNNVMIVTLILIQPVRREDNEKSRNGRGKGRSENSRKDTEQFEICR